MLLQDKAYFKENLETILLKLPKHIDDVDSLLATLMVYCSLLDDDTARLKALLKGDTNQDIDPKRLADVTQRIMSNLGAISAQITTDNATDGTEDPLTVIRDLFAARVDGGWKYDEQVLNNGKTTLSAIFEKSTGCRYAIQTLSGDRCELSLPWGATANDVVKAFAKKENKVTDKDVFSEGLLTLGGNVVDKNSTLLVGKYAFTFVGPKDMDPKEPKKNYNIEQSWSKPLKGARVHYKSWLLRAILLHTALIIMFVGLCVTPAMPAAFVGVLSALAWKFVAAGSLALLAPGLAALYSAVSKNVRDGSKRLIDMIPQLFLAMVCLLPALVVFMPGSFVALAMMFKLQTGGVFASMGIGVGLGAAFLVGVQSIGVGLKALARCIQAGYRRTAAILETLGGGIIVGAYAMLVSACAGMLALGKQCVTWMFAGQSSAVIGQTIASAAVPLLVKPVVPVAITAASTTAVSLFAGGLVASRERSDDTPAVAPTSFQE